LMSMSIRVVAISACFHRVVMSRLWCLAAPAVFIDAAYRDVSGR